MVGVLHELSGHESQQFLFHLQGRLARGDSGAVTEAEDVGIHRHRRLSEGGVEHHVGGLSSDAGQRLQRLAVGGDLSPMLRDQDGAGFDDVAGLGIEQSDGADVVL